MGPLSGECCSDQSDTSLQGVDQGWSATGPSASPKPSASLLFMTTAILIYNFYPVTTLMVVLLTPLNDIPICRPHAPPQAGRALCRRTRRRMTPDLRSVIEHK